MSRWVRKVCVHYKFRDCACCCADWPTAAPICAEEFVSGLVVPVNVAVPPLNSTSSALNDVEVPAVVGAVTVHVAVSGPDEDTVVNALVAVEVSVE